VPEAAQGTHSRVVSSMLDRRWSAPPYRAKGDDADEARRLVARGELRVVLLDVHAPATVRDTFSLRLAALRLVVPPRLRGAVVCLDTAVWLFAGGPAPASVDVALAPGRSRPWVRGLRVHELAYSGADLWRPLPDDPVTTPARTAADLACRLPAADAVAVLAVLGLSTGLRPGQVHGVLAGLEGRPGVRRAREAVLSWSRLLSPSAPPRARTGWSVDPIAGDAVGVEDALDLPHGVDDVVEVTRRGHLEGEPRDRDAVA
jgi:hypothetical protein